VNRPTRGGPLRLRPALTACLLVWVLLPAPALGQAGSAAGLAMDPTVPELAPLVAEPASPLRIVVERYREDRAALLRRHDAPFSSARRGRLRDFYGSWRARLAALDFPALDREGRVDYILLDNRLRFELAMLDEEEARAAEVAPLLPFAEAITTLQETRRRRETTDPRDAARTLTLLERQVAESRRRLEGSAGREAGGNAPGPVAAFRAAQLVDELRGTLEGWYRFRGDYDPLFTWWVEVPHQELDRALRDYATFLRSELAGIREGETPIVGDPVGATGLSAHLATTPTSPAPPCTTSSSPAITCRAS